MSCESCQTSQRDSCANAICPVCLTDCQTSQAFCATSGQTDYNSFSFSGCLSTGEIISITAADLEAAISQINSTFSKGSKSNASSSMVSTGVNTSYLTASDFNKIASAVGESTRNQGDVIKGTYFSSLQDAIQNIKFKSTQCDMCNSGCDAGCNSCQPSCNTSQCISCDSDERVDCVDPEPEEKD